MSVRSATGHDKIIGQKIRARRLIEKMSQETLGEKIGVSFQQVQKYEKGTNRVSYSRLVQIADTLNEGVSFFTEDTSTVSEEGRAIQEAMAQPDVQKIALSVMRMTPVMRKAILDFVKTLEAS
jgi:transcriptional regulator with XRE-family HTH domain